METEKYRAHCIEAEKLDKIIRPLFSPDFSPFAHPIHYFLCISRMFAISQIKLIKKLNNKNKLAKSCYSAKAIGKSSPHFYSTSKKFISFPLD